MNDVFSDMVNVSVIIYLDDILIYSDTLAEHREYVHEVLQRLQFEALLFGFRQRWIPQVTIDRSAPC